jgi:hypothetical protein
MLKQVAHIVTTVILMAKTLSLQEMNKSGLSCLQEADVVGKNLNKSISMAGISRGASSNTSVEPGVNE